jgi:PPOX class probable F420-dependent enzyme
VTSDDVLAALLIKVNRSVLATIKRDGRPQLSNVLHSYDPGTRIARISTRDPLAKTHNLRRDPRASLHVTSDDFWTWTVAECTAQLTPVAADTHDATVAELVDYYRAIRGEHPDWDEYRRAMVRERRVVLRLHVERFYGAAR